MNKIKKLSIVLVALAMCMMLGVTVWAAGDVTYSATPEKATLCVMEPVPEGDTPKMQRVTVTIKASKEIAITSMYLEVIIPEGWSINTIRGSDTVVIDESNYNPETGKDLIVWYESEAENKTTTTLLTIDYDAPAGTTGTFTLGVENLELATMNDEGDNLEVLETPATVTTTVTIQDHIYDGTTHKCVCGAEKHEHAQYKQVGNDQHQSVCSCGMAFGEPEAHTHKEYKFKDQLDHVSACVCGASISGTAERHTNDTCVCGAFKVVLDYNGGTQNGEYNEMVSYVNAGADYRLTLNTSEPDKQSIKKDGYHIVGLAYDKDGQQVIEQHSQNSYIIPVTGPTTFYLVWEPNHVCEHDHYEITENTHQSYCSCGEKIGTPETHTYVNGECVCGAEEPAPAGLKGDIDLDGDVDMDDLTYFAKHIAKIITITDAQSLENADVTGDGEVTMDDLTKLAKYIAKIIPDLD